MSPDLINVFRQAGHLLGLVSVGLTVGKVSLRVVPEGTRVWFDWQSGNFSQHYCMMFSALDVLRDDELQFHASTMVEKWNSFGPPVPTG